jgi:LysM repeat protein
MLIVVLIAILTPVVALTAAIGILHWRWPSPVERFRTPIRTPRWADLTSLGRLTTVSGLIAVVAATTIIFILLLGQRSGSDKFSEFYLLGADDTADGYPTTLSVGEKASLTLGIVNHEGKDAIYDVSLFINGTLADRIIGVRLKPREQWQRSLTFTLTEGGENQLMEFVLYRDRHSRPYRTLRLWVDGQETLAASEVIEEVLAETEAPTPASEEAPPPESPAPEPPAAPQYEVHVVSRGENLTLISRRYDVPLKSIIKANASEITNPSLIYPNQHIQIPLEAR